MLTSVAQVVDGRQFMTSPSGESPLGVVAMPSGSIGSIVYKTNNPGHLGRRFREEAPQWLHAGERVGG